MPSNQNPNAPALLSPCRETENGALRVGSGNLQPNGPPIITRSYRALPRTSSVSSRNHAANGTSPRRRRHKPAHARDPTFSKAELRSDRYIAYREKQRQNRKKSDVWTDELEDIFLLALREIPNLGRKKITCDVRKCGTLESKACGRNEHIMHFILHHTGVKRNRKQVSSHIQVLKNIMQDRDEWMALVTRPSPNEVKSFTIDVYHTYPIPPAPSGALSLKASTTPTGNHSALDATVPKTPLADYPFPSALSESDLPVIEARTSQEFYYHPHPPNPPTNYQFSSQDMGEMGLQFISSQFPAQDHQQTQPEHTQSLSSQIEPSRTDNARDQEFVELAAPFSFLKQRRTPGDPAPTVNILHRNVQHLGNHQQQNQDSQDSQHHHKAAQRSTHQEILSSDLFDIDNHWHPADDIPFDMNEWPVPNMDHDDIQPRWANSISSSRLQHHHHESYAGQADGDGSMVGQDQMLSAEIGEATNAMDVVQIVGVDGNIDIELGFGR